MRLAGYSLYADITGSNVEGTIQFQPADEFVVRHGQRTFWRGDLHHLLPIDQFDNAALTALLHEACM